MEILVSNIGIPDISVHFCLVILAYVTKLTAENIIVSGSVTAQHKKFGPEFNQGEIHHNGSVFYLKWSSVHQCSSLNTTNGAATVTWNLAVNHNLIVGDTDTSVKSLTGLSLTVFLLPSLQEHMFSP